MRTGLLIGLAVGVGLTSAVATAAEDGFTLKGSPKIAVLYFDAKNDGGWTQSMHEARERMEKALGLTNRLRRKDSGNCFDHSSGCREVHPARLQYHYRRRVRTFGCI